jgi:hypothetical protein
VPGSSTFLDEVQAATPELDVAAVLARAGTCSIAEVRRDLARLGYDQADIDRVVPADADADW